MSNETNRYTKDFDSSLLPEIPPVDKIEMLAKQQGVSAVINFDDLLGDFWPEDESADDFIAATRKWGLEPAKVHNN